MLEKFRVLVVDDASFMRDIVKKGMRSAFPAFHLDEAAHGKQAQHLITKSKYDLILCDWEMPEMTGAELLEWLRGTPDTQDIPFIMITSRGDKEHVVEAIKLKVSNYIVKPFTSEKLVKVVTSTMTKALGISAKALHDLGGGKGSMDGVGGLSGAIPIAAHLDSSGAEVGSGGVARTKAPASVKPKERVVVQLRFSDETTTCLVKELSTNCLRGVIRRSDKIPGILELAVIDIEVKGEISRLNGYIHTLQARDDSRETEFVNIDIHLVDQADLEKMEHLQHYMSSIV